MRCQIRPFVCNSIHFQKSSGRFQNTLVIICSRAEFKYFNYIWLVSEIFKEFFHKKTVKIIENMFWNDSLFAKFWPVSAIFHYLGKHFSNMKHEICSNRFWTWLFNFPSKINSGVLWRIKKIWITKHGQFLASSLWKNKSPGCAFPISQARVQLIFWKLNFDFLNSGSIWNPFKAMASSSWVERNE